MFGPEVFLILIGWAIGGGSPGPATLAISSTSMQLGRQSGLTLAAGIVVGSASWGIAAALGMSAMMAANAWILELLRYVGAAYLLFLAWKSLRRAWDGKAPAHMKSAPKGHLFVKGLLLHLTNPKAILGWGAIYAIALPLNAPMSQVWIMFAMLITVSQIVFFGYAFLFSIPRVAAGYRAAGRWFDTAFGVLFGAASLKILTTRLGAS